MLWRLVMRLTLGHLGFVAALAILGTACQESPAEIRIKGPADGSKLINEMATLPVFENDGDTIQLRTSAFDKKGRYMGSVEVKWESSNRDVAIVSTQGLVTVLGSGDTKIKATTVKGNLSYEMSLTARIVSGIKITEPAKTDELVKLPMGDFLQFKAEVTNDHGEVLKDAKVKWSTSNWAATVTPTGLVEGRAIGTVQVVAENEKGEVDRFDMEVTDWDKRKRR